MKNTIISMILIITILSCNNQKNTYSNNDLRVPENIGEIPFDPNLDSESFKLCHEDRLFPVSPHSGIGYKGNKPALLREIREAIKKIEDVKSGYVTIRFIVNCKGKSGRFRIIQMDMNYKTIHFKKETIDKLLTEVKSLKNWSIAYGRDNSAYDYHQYLTFKFEDGIITEILP